MSNTKEMLIDRVNDFFGCDAAYFDVNPDDLATHLIRSGATMFKFNLGLQVRDTKTGFVGQITARAEYNSGTTLYLLEDKSRREVWVFEEGLVLCYGD
jgi:hypothetical protein